jgi:nucleotide sugar dehydrogenase
MHPNKIAVVGAGRVGTPMAALLASTAGTDGSPPPRVVVVQRASATSGWKVDAINSGHAPTGTHEPGLAALVAECVARGTLAATHDIDTCHDADVILVCTPTDTTGLAPDYSALTGALRGVAKALGRRPVPSRPLVIVQSTLAPAALQCVVRPVFEAHGLRDGQDVLIGFSPTRMSQGKALESLRSFPAIAAGLHPETPLVVASVLRRITSGRVHVTNALTAELAKTVQNADRDVRIALSTELARYCDRIDVDYSALRERVNDVVGWPDDSRNEDPRGGALLVPTAGVGGHGVPRDGILLWWKALEAGHPSRNSVILAARGVNDASPAATVRLARMELGSLHGRRVAVLGAAYRAGIGDTHHAPSLVLAGLLRDSGADVVLHDPLVPEHDHNLECAGLANRFSNDPGPALRTDVIVLATGHGAFRELLPRLRASSSGIDGIIDAAGLFDPSDFDGLRVRYAGIGRGRRAPAGDLVRSATTMYRAVSRGIANELESVVRFLNARFAEDAFHRVDFDDVRRLAATSFTGCRVEEPGPLDAIMPHEGFVSGLAQLAADAEVAGTPDPRRGPSAHAPAGLWFGNEEAVVSTDTPWPLTPRQ